MNIIWWIIIGVVVLIILWLVFTYNRLIKFKNRTEEAWSDIDVQLKRRHDLIPNLINTVKGYAKHEREVFEKVTETRAQAMNAEGAKEKAQAENQLTEALKSLFAVSENYPDLKASNNFLELQRELTDTENKIQAARRFYNNNIKDYNIKLQSFPINLVANVLGFQEWDYFEIENETEKEPVNVEF